MHRILSQFRSQLLQDFELPTPYRGKSQTNWLVSAVWSDFLRAWLPERYGSCRWEFPLPRQRRLDAALCRQAGAELSQSDGSMDLALEWEWDQNKVYESFPTTDFRKLFQVRATCGLAIVQTRVDGRRGTDQANATMERLRTHFTKYRTQYQETAGTRDIAVVEIRRMEHTPQHVCFEGFWWLNGTAKPTALRTWEFSAS